MGDKNAAFQKRRGRGNYLEGVGLARSAITLTRRAELPATKLFCAFFKVTLKNGFKASLYPVDFVAACNMRADEQGRGFWQAAKKKEAKMFQKAEKVFKEKE